MEIDKKRLFSLLDNIKEENAIKSTLRDQILIIDGL
jgi:hypothetical protein